MKVREIITLDGWVDGSGVSFSSCWSDEEIEISADTPEELREQGVDLDWWDPGENTTGCDDTLVTVRLYDVDADPHEDAALAECSMWESDLIGDDDEEEDEEDEDN